MRGFILLVVVRPFLLIKGVNEMKNIKLNDRQQALVNEYYEYGKTVVVTNFHFADGKEISTGYSLEDAYQEAAVALCIAAANFNADRGVLFKTYAVTVIRNHLKKVMFTKKIAEYPLESIDDSPMFSYEMESSVEYCEMVDLIRHSSNAKDKGRSLSYRILTDKVFRHQPMTVIADRYHLKKSAAYRRLNEARGDFYRSYLMNREQALSA